MNISEENLKILPSKTGNLLARLSGEDFLDGFYLAGGTALVLEFKHRISNDLDFFTEKKFSDVSLKNNLKKIGGWEASIETEDTLVGYLDGVKVSFFYLPYKLIDRTKNFNKIKIAGLTDIALMKILAVSQRATKRDFVDLYILADGLMPLSEMIKIFPKKFGKFDYNIHHIVKSLVYFDEVEKDKMPKMITEIGWRDIRKFFLGEHKNLLKTLTE